MAADNELAADNERQLKEWKEEQAELAPVEPAAKPPLPKSDFQDPMVVAFDHGEMSSLGESSLEGVSIVDSRTLKCAFCGLGVLTSTLCLPGKQMGPHPSPPEQQNAAWMTT